MERQFASSFTTGLCTYPQCRSIHVDLKDKNGQTFASMVVPVERVPALIRELQALAYRITTGEKL